MTSNWVVIVEVEAAGEAEADPTFEVSVTALDEVDALKNSMTELRALHPDMNFGKTYCWHIRRADGEAQTRPAFGRSVNSSVER